jgi:hypothetical protein
MPYDSVTMTNDRGGLLEHMDRDHFLRSVQRAELESEQAQASRDTLILWAKRLLPYLDANPDLTIAEAIDLYKSEHRGRNDAQP